MSISKEEANFLLACIKATHPNVLAGAQIDVTQLEERLHKLAGNKNVFKATVEYGLMGYVYDTADFKAGTLNGLVEAINKKTMALQEKISKSDEKHGDLREFCLEFSNGYPSFGGIEPEFGDDDWCGTLTSFSIGGHEISYTEAHYSIVRGRCFLS